MRQVSRHSATVMGQWSRNSGGEPHMRVFVTGGTGTIGSAVVAELLANGHAVLALARSDDSAQTLKDAAAEPFRGEIAALDARRAGRRRDLPRLRPRLQQRGCPRA